VIAEKEKLSLTTEQLAELGRRDFYIFAKGICRFDWLTAHIHKPLCRLLELYEGWNESLGHPKNVYEEVLRGALSKSDFPPETQVEQLEKLLEEGVKRLVIVLPRGWLKTTLCSQAYPLWRSIRNPQVRTLLAQNTYKNAVSKLIVIDGVVKRNALFRSLYPEILPDSTCKWKNDQMCLKRDGTFADGTFEAAGTKTQVTSRHFNVIIEDDTVAPDKDDLGEDNLMPTKDDVDQAIGWHRLATPLLVNPRNDQILIVGTRWFEKDLISWVRERNKGVGNYLFYARGCLEKDGVPDESGEVTYEERFDEAVLAELKESLGPYLFSCLYLNKPLRSQDMIFKRDWFQYYETPPQSLVCYTTVDPGGDPEESKGETDWNVVMTCGKDIRSGLVYVLEYSRKKCSPGELISMIFKHVMKYSPVKVGIETTAYQKSLKYWIKERMRKTGTWFLIEGLTHSKRSKGQRIMGLQPVIASGSLRFKSYMVHLINELLVYPLGKNDDLADTLSSQLELWRMTSSVEEERTKEQGLDPLSVTAAIEELQARGKDTTGPLVFDMFLRVG